MSYGNTPPSPIAHFYYGKGSLNHPLSEIYQCVSHMHVLNSYLKICERIEK